MPAETVAEITGGGEDSGEGRIRISEGGMMASMNSAVSTVIFVVVNMVFNAVIGLSFK